MLTGSKRILCIWILLLASSGAFLFYLSSRPNMMLWVEEFHPSNAYQRGRELKEDGNLKEALESFQRGCDFFFHLAEKSQSRRHWLQYVQGLMEMAKVFELYGDVDSLKQSVSLISKAVKIAPRYAQGEPFLSMGVMLQRMKNYQDAIDAFTEAYKNGGALLALEAMWGRALCYWELGEKKAACRDWYVFARFHGCNVPQVWDFLSGVPNDLCPEALFLHACKTMFTGKSGESNELWEGYLKINPDDRCANYFYKSNERNWYDSDGTIDLAQTFPAAIDHPHRFYSFLFDLFNDNDEECELFVELSCPESDSLTNKVVVNRGNEVVKEIVLLSPKKQIYSIKLPIHQGSNIFQVFVIGDEGHSSVTPLYVHSLSVELDNR